MKRQCKNFQSESRKKIIRCYLNNIRNIISPILSLLQVQTLDYVTSDVAASVATWRLPRKRHTLITHTLSDEEARWTRRAGDVDTDLAGVGAERVLED